MPYRWRNLQQTGSAMYLISIIIGTHVQGATAVCVGNATADLSVALCENWFRRDSEEQEDGTKRNLQDFMLHFILLRS